MAGNWDRNRLRRVEPEVVANWERVVTSISPFLTNASIMIHLADMTPQPELIMTEDVQAVQINPSLLYQDVP